MKFIFIDETEQNNIFAISVIVMDSSRYGSFKKKYLDILKKYSWDHKDDKNEFKGTAILGSTKTNSLSPQGKKDMCYELLNIIQSTNKIVRPYIAYHNLSKDNSQNKIGAYKQRLYFKSIPLILKKALKKSSAKSSKNVVCIFCDEFSIANKNKTEYQKMRKEIASILKLKNLIFFEEIYFSKSTNYTIGISYADLIGYLLLKEKNSEKDEYSDEIKEILGKIAHIVEEYDHTDIIK